MPVIWSPQVTLQKPLCIRLNKSNRCVPLLQAIQLKESSACEGIIKTEKEPEEKRDFQSVPTHQHAVSEKQMSSWLLDLGLLEYPLSLCCCFFCLLFSHTLLQCTHRHWTTIYIYLSELLYVYIPSRDLRFSADTRIFKFLILVPKHFARDHSHMSVHLPVTVFHTVSTILTLKHHLDKLWKPISFTQQSF